MTKKNFIACKVSDEMYNQIQKNIKEYHFENTSDYMRCALEFFDVRRFNASKQNEVSIITDCVKLLEQHKREVQNTMIQEAFNKLDKNVKPMASENEKKLNQNSENVKPIVKPEPPEVLNKNGEKVKPNNNSTTQNNDKQFKAVIDTLIRITAVKGRPTSDDFKFQAQRCGKKKSELENYYIDNQDFFINESMKLH